MHDPIVKHSYVQLNNSYVHLSQYCANENSFLKFSNPPKIIPPRLIIFVPGNPGLLGMYHDFLLNLFRAANNCTTSEVLFFDSSTNNNNDVKPAEKQFINILAIGHNNFDHPQHTNFKTEETIIIDDGQMNFVERTLASKHANESHHMDLQVLNKTIILKRLLNGASNTARIVFVGHSIGSYIILRLLQERVFSTHHEGTILIHPALENLALTEKGSFFNQVFQYKLDYPLRAIAYLMDILIPKRIKQALAKYHFSTEYMQHSSEIAVESLISIVSHKSLVALIEMAKSEFATVKNLDADSLIGPHSNKLRLIYAINDHWVNTDNRKFLQDRYPDLFIEEQPRMHAFVMEPETVMDYAVKIGLYVQTFFEPEPDSN